MEEHNVMFVYKMYMSGKGLKMYQWAESEGHF